VRKSFKKQERQEVMEQQHQLKDPTAKPAHSR